VAVLLLGHALEEPGGVREFVAQAIGVGAVDAGVVLFGGDGEGEDLALREVGETAALVEETHGCFPRFRIIPN